MEKSLVLFVSTLGVLENVDTETKEIKSFVCCMLGKSNLSSFNLARNVLFHQPFHQRKMQKLKGQTLHDPHYVHQCVWRN